MLSGENCLSNDSTFSQLNVKKALTDIRISNMNKLIFGYLYINSLKNKFDLLSEQVKGSIDILMVSETKLDDSFPKGQFLIEGSIRHLDLTAIEMVEESCYTFGKISPLNYLVMTFPV